MSKKVEVKFSCPHCDHTFETELYRTLWIEYPELRELVFNDTLNVVQCEKCGEFTDTPLAVLCTNSPRQIAVWHEPFHDEQVDVDMAMYSALYGPDSFLANAPRIADWKEFKETILKFERGELVGKAGNTPEFAKLAEMARVAGSGSGQRRRGFLSRIFGRK